MKSQTKKLANLAVLVMGFCLSCTCAHAQELNIQIIDPDNTLKRACGIILGVLTVAAWPYLLIQVMLSGYLISGSWGNSEKEATGWKAFFSAIKGGLIMFGAWGIAGVIYFFAFETLYK